MSARLSLEDNLILCCCGINLRNETIKKIEQILLQKLDWDYISKILYKHDIANLIYNNLRERNNKNCIPAAFLKTLSLAYFKTAQKNILYLKEYYSIAKSFNKQNINFIPLKGIWFVEEIYKNIALRNFTDTDILVQKNDLYNAEMVLKNQGFTKKKTDRKMQANHFHSFFWKKGRIAYVVELHWDIDYVNTPFNVSIQELWANKAEICRQEFSFYRLSNEDTILHNSLHIIQHAVEQHFISLKNLCDLSELIRANTETISWDGIAAQAERYKLSRPVLVVAVLLNKLFNAQIPKIFFSSLTQTQHDDADKFIQSIIQHRIFSLHSSSPHPPQQLVSFITGNNLFQKVGIIYPILKSFFRQFETAYYTDIHHSFLRAFIVTIQGTMESLSNYFKTLYHFLTNYKQTHVLIEKEAAFEQEQKELDTWICGK